MVEVLYCSCVLCIKLVSEYHKVIVLVPMTVTVSISFIFYLFNLVI